MQKPANYYFIFAAVMTFIGAVLHLSMIFGGPAWYRFFGAPEGLVALAAAGSIYPVFVCVFIASVLFTWSAYAFSGTEIIGKLPFLRTILTAVSILLIVRGVLFIPLMLISPEIFRRITNSQSVDAFLIITSMICLVAGLLLAAGLNKAWQRLTLRK